MIYLRMTSILDCFSLPWLTFVSESMNREYMALIMLKDCKKLGH